MICKSTDKLELISLIDPIYVEEAFYPDSPRRTPRSGLNKWLKTAVAFSAVLAVALVCVKFYPEIRAFADRLFNSATFFDDAKIADEQMNAVHINDVTEEALEKPYQTLDEVEALLGINLLQSPLASSTLYPCVRVSMPGKSDLVNISDGAYYLYHCKTTPKTEGDGIYIESEKDDAFTVSYEAELIVSEAVNGERHDYENARLLENYTTANGLKAAVFQFGSCYNAIIYHNDIRYAFCMTGCYGNAGDINAFKAFLDTLSDK